MNKKIASLLLITAMVLASVSITPKSVKASWWWNDIVSQKNSIKIKWKVKKKASKYEVYRAIAKDYNVMPKKSKFKKIKTIRNKYIKSYTDKKVKKGKFYAYYVKAIKGKKKVIADTYTKKYMQIKSKGISPPELECVKYKDCYKDLSSDVVIRFSDSCTGCSFSNNIKFYRKADHQKRYKPIKLTKETGYREWRDKNTLKGHTYYYKAKVYKKKKKKTTYSGYSVPIKITTYNYKAKYKIETITKTGVYKDRDYIQDVIVKLSDASIFNGTTVIKGTGIYSSDYILVDDEFAYPLERMYDVHLDGYSYDNVNYRSIPEIGVEIKKNTPVYLKLYIKTRSGRVEDIYWGGNDCKYAKSFVESYQFIKYKGPLANSEGYSYFDFKKGVGFAY